MTPEQRYLFHAIAYLGRLQIGKSAPTKPVTDFVETGFLTCHEWILTLVR